ncbi:hypothetical protein CBM2609_U10018 [Cupriavidus taiwanensis]|nr:hypothetical protein CBM2604_U10078 [Cupriavidus taiwanensis]SOZ34422.1 hypothetical protein CBM2609_U10018 [Cupriavidus taiwanensis]
MNRPISPGLRKLKSLACATSSANLIDQQFLSDNGAAHYRHSSKFANKGPAPTSLDGKG